MVSRFQHCHLLWHHECESLEEETMSLTALLVLRSATPHSPSCATGVNICTPTSISDNIISWFTFDLYLSTSFARSETCLQVLFTGQGVLFNPWDFFVNVFAVLHRYSFVDTPGYRRLDLWLCVSSIYYALISCKHLHLRIGYCWLGVSCQPHPFWQLSTQIVSLFLVPPE